MNIVVAAPKVEPHKNRAKYMWNINEMEWKCVQTTEEQQNNQ